ncbi:NAD(P)H nitroreductase [Mycolicibacterium sp. Y3]
MPSAMLPPQLLSDAVEMACRAPSLHNSQPWRWVAEGTSTLNLYAEPGRALTTLDPLGREIYLSCGAALDHLVVALAAAGWVADVQRFPDPAAPLHLAEIHFRPVAGDISVQACERAEAILARHTDLRPFEAPADWPRLEVTLRQKVIPYHVMFDTVLPPDRPRLAETWQLAEELNPADHRCQPESCWWASELDHSETVVLSTSHEDSRHDLLRCGEALSAVLLECTMAGQATCTLSHMTELAQPRELLRALIDQRGTPQVLIRVGQAEVKPGFTMTPRKSLAQVMDFEPEAPRLQ